MIKHLAFISILILFCSSLHSAEVCKIDFEKLLSNPPKDCVVCQTDIKVPSTTFEKTTTPFVNYVTGEKEQKETIARLRMTEYFLSKKGNNVRCSNYKELTQNYLSEFYGLIAICEKGAPSVLDKKNLLCPSVLESYAKIVTKIFHDYWTEYLPNGKIREIPGRQIEHLEGPIRIQEAWCRKVEANYKNKITIGCGDLKEWVHLFDITKKVSEAMKRDMASSEKAVIIDNQRKQSFDDACKIFDKKNANYLTQNFYLECITR